MTVISELRSLRNYLNPNKEGSSSLWLYQGTAGALFAFCMLVSGIQHFGEPIQCVQDKKDEDAAINERVMNSFCFISNTYTVSNDGLGYGCDGIGRYYAGPGVGPNPSDEKDIRRHSYYIWVPFILFFQAVTFLVPNSYWSYCEGGLVRQLLAGLTGVDISPEENKTKILEVSTYFQKRLTTHQFFTSAWIFHDILSFGIVLGNFFLTDCFLGGWFRNFGGKVLGFVGNESNCWNPFDDAFPKVTKCTFHKFGAGGGLQNFDSLCVMALNVVNEKIYIILWLWFLILIPVSFFCLLLKFGAILCLKCLKKKHLKMILQFSWVRLLTGIPSFMSPATLGLFVERFDSGDWIFFSRLTPGMSCATCKDFIANVKELIDMESSSRDGSLV